MNIDVIRMWKNKEDRNLSNDTLGNPVGLVEITDVELENVAGGVEVDRCGWTCSWTCSWTSFAEQ